MMRLIQIQPYLQAHPIRTLLVLVAIFSLLFVLFLVQKKRPTKWVFLVFLMLFIPISFKIIQLARIRQYFQEQTNFRIENTELSAFETNGIQTFGIDISHHQGEIQWDSLRNSKHPIQFIFIRATYGASNVDRQYQRNWQACQSLPVVKGAYHYYLPEQNSTSQFERFKRIVHLKKGDLPPVLDLEEDSRFGRKNLLKGVKNWLNLAERHYGIKPIIYTNVDFFERYFDSREFKNYTFWMAAYSGRHRIENLQWTFHQFSDKMIIKGISVFVDGNDFNGTRKELEKICIQS